MFAMFEPFLWIIWHISIASCLANCTGTSKTSVLWFWCSKFKYFICLGIRFQCQLRTQIEQLYRITKLSNFSENSVLLSTSGQFVVGKLLTFRLHINFCPSFIYSLSSFVNSNKVYTQEMTYNSCSSCFLESIRPHCSRLTTNVITASIHNSSISWLRARGVKSAQIYGCNKSRQHWTFSAEVNDNFVRAFARILDKFGSEVPKHLTCL